MVRRLYTLFAELPALMRIGLSIVLAGGALDMLYHGLPAGAAAIVDGYLGQGGWSFHLLAMAGMAITLAGLFTGRMAPKARGVRHARTERRQHIES